MSNRGGMSVSNQYDIVFSFTASVAAEIAKGLGGSTTTTTSDNYIIKYFCDEAQLPNVGTMTGNLTGRYTGMGTTAYAHTPIYTEFQLGWMCDANMTPLKFLTGWHNYMIGATFSNTERGKRLENVSSPSKKLAGNRTNIIRYPDEYVCDITVTKVENGQTEDTRRPSISYLMERAFPISIDAVPLSYGNSQLTRVTATFQYQRHQVTTNELTASSLFNSSRVRNKVDISEVQTEQNRSETYIRNDTGGGAGSTVLSGFPLSNAGTA
jgi:hypothetical protein